MKKIPTVFKRNPDDMRRVLSDVTPGCEWVLAGEGTATRKYDGTCCLVRDGRLYKRHEVKPAKAPPADFEEVDHDDVTGKTVGWVPVGDGPEDRWHREAWEDHKHRVGGHDGTYELVGPKVQGNPEGFSGHWLICHADADEVEAPRNFADLRGWMGQTAFEGIVWHHPDGRMAKLKRRDFPKERD